PVDIVEAIYMIPMVISAADAAEKYLPKSNNFLQGQPANSSANLKLSRNCAVHLLKGCLHPHFYFIYRLLLFCKNY
ncbi:MAG: hypothetical protein KDC37_07030, partial [Flavobacteriales bacterium]|nr:hypothetical protein [Flavobacteriales bacterium]